MLTIKAEACCGDSAELVVKEMCSLAYRMRCWVKLDFNGILLCASSHTTPREIYDAYRYAISEGREGFRDYSLACAVKQKDQPKPTKKRLFSVFLNLVDSDGKEQTVRSWSTDLKLSIDGYEVFAYPQRQA